MVLSSAQEVATALSIVRQAGCKFAVRTSGHNPNVGFSSVDGAGVVLDLAGLDGRSLDGEGEGSVFLRAGPGNRWGPVYEFLQEKGCRLLVAGRCRSGSAGSLLEVCVFFSSLFFFSLKYTHEQWIHLPA